MRPHDGRAIPTFLRQAMTDRPLTVFGDGSQTRSFCYVDDLIDGLVRLMDTPADVTGPINIGNPREFTIRELAEQVIRLTGSRSELVREPLPADDPTQRKPDISHAMSSLGWTPTVQLDEGLRRTIAYFEAVLDQQDGVSIGIPSESHAAAA